MVKLINIGFKIASKGFNLQMIIQKSFFEELAVNSKHPRCYYVSQVTSGRGTITIHPSA
jgi:hypothetical protein